MPMKKKEIRVRCWITVNGEKHFGPGPAELLERIQSSGSIAKAAAEMRMSYKKAWDIIENMNARGSKPYVIARKGGKKGGGTEVTAPGKKVLKSYESLKRRIQEVVRKERALLKLI